MKSIRQIYLLPTSGRIWLDASVAWSDTPCSRRLTVLSDILAYGCTEYHSMLQKSSTHKSPLFSSRRPLLVSHLVILLVSVVGQAFISLPIFAQSPEKVVSLFDGKTLTGWKTVDPTHQKLWSVADSMIKSGDGVHKIPENTYLHTLKEYGDFEFRCLFRLHGDPKTGMINSGIQYRSLLEGGKIVGYQADIGNGFWGDLYDEHRREKLVSGDLRTLKHLLKEDGWNSYIIRCKGNRHELYINGVKTCDYIEKDSKIPQKGVIAVQIHSGGVAQVEFRDLVIVEL